MANATGGSGCYGYGECGWIHFRCCETSDERGISTEPSSELVTSAFFPLFLQCLLWTIHSKTLRKTCQPAHLLVWKELQQLDQPTLHIQLNMHRSTITHELRLSMPIKSRERNKRKQPVRWYTICMAAVMTIVVFYSILPTSEYGHRTSCYESAVYSDPVSQGLYWMEVGEKGNDKLIHDAIGLWWAPVRSEHCITHTCGYYKEPIIMAKTGGEWQDWI